LAGRDTPEFRAKLKILGERMEGMSQVEYFDAHVACVFLEDNRCTIYKQRPVVCRSHFSFSPAELCSPPTHNKPLALADTSRVKAEDVAIGQHVAEMLGLKQTRMRVLAGSLPRIVWIVLEAIAQDADLREFLKAQPWPTVDNLDAWVKLGQSPFRKERENDPPV
jgi:hypothetical protein